MTLTETVHAALDAIAPPASETPVPPGAAVTEPPHVVTAFGAAAIVTFEGNASLSDTLESGAEPAAVFATVIVIVDVPPGRICAGENVFESATAAAFETSKGAVAGVEFVTPCADVTAEAGIVLTYEPTVDDVTLTVIVHVAPAASAPPESVTLLVPLVVAVPPHVVAGFGAAASTTPAGSVSLNPTLVSAMALVPVFATAIVKVEIPVGTISTGANTLLTETGAGLVTFSGAVAGAGFVTFCALETAPAGIVFVYDPTAVDVTVTVTVHLAPAASAPPAKLTTFVPIVVAAPPQVVVGFGAAASTTPAGSVSLSASAVSGAAPAAELSIEIVSCEAAPLTMVAGANTLETLTGEPATTVSGAVAGALFDGPWAVLTEPAGIVFV